MTLIEYFNDLEQTKREKMKEVIDWVSLTFPTMKLAFKWNQPMFVDHDTFIIAFSHAKKHMSVAPEKVVLDYFIKDIKKYYETTKMLFHIKWDQNVNYDLLKNLIEYSLVLKKDYNKFWL